MITDCPLRQGSRAQTAGRCQAGRRVREAAGGDSADLDGVEVLARPQLTLAMPCQRESVSECEPGVFKRSPEI